MQYPHLTEDQLNMATRAYQAAAKLLTLQARGAAKPFVPKPKPNIKSPISVVTLDDNESDNVGNNDDRNLKNHVTRVHEMNLGNNGPNNKNEVPESKSEQSRLQTRSVNLNMGRVIINVDPLMIKVKIKIIHNLFNIYKYWN